MTEQIYLQIIYCLSGMFFTVNYVGTCPEIAEVTRVCTLLVSCRLDLSQFLIVYCGIHLKRGTVFIVITLQPTVIGRNL